MKDLFVLVLPLILFSCSSETNEEGGKAVKPEDYYGLYELDGPADYTLEISPDGKIYLTNDQGREVADWNWVKKGVSMDWTAGGRTIGVELELEGDKLTVRDQNGNKMVYHRIDQE